MLRLLHVRDYALIDELEVEFGPGLNVITGETGAGKSILLGALKLILGERASTEAIRTGARKAIVEGVFDQADSPGIARVLAEHGIEAMPSGVLIVRREVSPTHSRAFVNDTPATLNVLRDAAEQLIDLHGQHEHQSLLRVHTHVDLLDGFARSGDLRAEYGRGRRELQDLFDRREELLREEDDLRREQELIAFQLEEIDRIDPQPEEDDALLAERRLLDNAERLHDATASLSGILYEGEGSVYDRLAAARDDLRELTRIDEGFQSTLAEIQQAEVVVEEAAKFLRDYHDGVEFNPQRLDAIRERLAQIDVLKRKYGGSLEAVLEHRASIGRKHDLAAGFDQSIEDLNDRISEARRHLSRAAIDLSEARHAGVADIEGRVEKELHSLGMPHARFEVRIRTEEDPEGWIEWPGEPPASVRAFASGADQVEFHVSANAGEPVRPLARVASGGEISRIMLALKAVLAQSERLPILVFDEIDVGISGEVARRVGETMRRLGGSHQLIAITHLPQIAALGSRQFIVEKLISDDATVTRTTIRPIDGDERARHIATLVSGRDVSDAALQSARELIAGGAVP